MLGSAAGALPSLTTAMLEAGASVVLEPGFAQLLDVVPPLAAAAAADQPPRILAVAGEQKEEAGVRRAVISRWAIGFARVRKEERAGRFFMWGFVLIA